MTYFTPTDIPAFGLARSDTLDTNFTAIANAFNTLPAADQINLNTSNYGADTGAVNAYVLTLAIAPASYSDGLEVVFKATTPNTAASTLNVNSLGAKSVVHTDGSALVANDISGITVVRYDSTLGKFVLINASAAAIAASSAAAASAAAASASASAASTSASNAATSASQAQSAAGVWLVKTSNYTASAFDRILADTSGGAFTVTLPASPSSGAYVQITDGGGTMSTNALTVERNGSTIMGLSEDMTITINNASIGLAYNGSTWRLF